MRVRQLVLVANERDPIVNDLESLFKIQVSFYDPGIKFFGLENAVLPVGDTFLEVVSPIEQETTAGRYLERRGGSGGYMVIIQVEDFESTKKRVEDNNMRVVYESEDPKARAIHLHPKDVGGAILSLDYMVPESSWKWAGESWKSKINNDVVEELNGVFIQSENPENMLQKWEAALGIKGTKEIEGHIINLGSSRVVFVKDEDGRGDGPSAFEIKVKNPQDVRDRAEHLGLIDNGEVSIGGVKFLLN
ncbi:MAG: hypothetical protein CMA27_05195 [Euryarchaeota archaeon]|nr:hypothetical protein [Euryarchaeota archaeon]|tara:strand:- start:605 stop:1345 length:741 start_codon:yes stop_codon:yes gene_type:complete